ncbi:hypothetical protein [Priestia endophytica]|uniref:hypothetical protein n=1 Tax=Priestia endophytica TaxID=135735 RepID=UPI00203D57EA|nr:hypothetical protein [Priestia endophytica]MCM3536598.1 hypothetical protein [Priestia endophytica]
MAVNLWKLTSGKTSYNPLPDGWINYADVNLGDYIVSFKAKSPTNARLGVCDNARDDFSVYLDLEKEFKEYTIPFKSTSSQRVYIYDTAHALDIVVEDIVLVEKPTGKFTFNLLPYFTNSDWVLKGADVKRYNDTTLVIEEGIAWRGAEVVVPALPNTYYTMSLNTDRADGYMLAYSNDKSGTSLASVGVDVNGLQYTTFKTNSDTTRLVIYVTNRKEGRYVYRDPMLIQGTYKFPYQDKIGSLGVLPVPRKNLIDDGGKEYSSGYREFINPIDLAPILNLYGIEKSYSLSFDLKSTDISKYNKMRVYMQNGNDSKYVFNAVTIEVTTEYQRYKLNNITFRKGDNVEKALLAFYGTYDTGNFPIVKNVQLEFGEIATDYEPFSVNFNERSERKTLALPTKKAVRQLEAKR